MAIDPATRSGTLEAPPTGGRVDPPVIEVASLTKVNAVPVAVATSVRGERPGAGALLQEECCLFPGPCPACASKGSDSLRS